MASAPQLPLFYKGLEPLSSETHADFRMKIQDKAPFLAGQHAIPITVDEFPLVQRHMPIVFSVGEDAIPLALMGLNEGVNVFVDDEGKLTENSFYVPAYVRRYPFMLAKLRPEATELSLCFDPTADALGKFEGEEDDARGEPLFVGKDPSELTKNILTFNESFEQAGQRTHNFMNELREQELLMDGEVSIQPDGAAQPFIYRGFQMVNEEKLQGMRGDQLRKIAQSGMLPLLYAHLFSLSLMREVFARQVQLGKNPQPVLPTV
ncbi:MAG: multidrug transporter [Sphingomonas bacterium]|uniref:SapC family protein n=1 Tax=Sphingomonas bacterium TaxID=1895847 RepID=UPI00261BCF44|nr:SapC family protein [Sphingomonas bacterium]MDB5695336.1 multidrug transporter [Sphingomonas bacterium]